MYELVSIDREGGEITYSRYSGDTAKLTMKYASRGIAAHVVFGSKEADLNLVQSGAGKDAKVIPGGYGILYGLATDRSMKKVYAGIVQGEFAPVEVKKGAKAVAEMGGPYRLDFEHSVVGRKLNISPSSFKLYGKGGERYVSFDYKGTPAISITSGGRIARSDKMESG